MEAVAFAPKKNLLAIKGISEAKADKIAVSVSIGITDQCQIIWMYDLTFRHGILQFYMKY